LSNLKSIYCNIILPSIAQQFESIPTFVIFKLSFYRFYSEAEDDLLADVEHSCLCLVGISSSSLTPLLFNQHSNDGNDVFVIEFPTTPIIESQIKIKWQDETTTPINPSFTKVFHYGNHYWIVLSVKKPHQEDRYQTLLFLKDDGSPTNWMKRDVLNNNLNVTDSDIVQATGTKYALELPYGKNKKYPFGKSESCENVGVRNVNLIGNRIIRDTYCFFAHDEAYMIFDEEQYKSALVMITDELRKNKNLSLKDAFSRLNQQPTNQQPTNQQPTNQQPTNQQPTNQEAQRKYFRNLIIIVFIAIILCYLFSVKGLFF